MSTNDAATPVLDPYCGSRMMYFDKHDRRVTFCDLHPRHSVLCDGRTLDVSPDMVEDFTRRLLLAAKKELG